MNENCAKCGSDKLIVDAMAIDRGDYNVEGNFSLAIDEKPAALVFKQRIRSNVSAVVCGECGLSRILCRPAGNCLSSSSKPAAKH